MQFHRCVCHLACSALSAASWSGSPGLSAAESKPVPVIAVQEESGAITLAARDATTHGTQMHYESSPLKNCLGYWFKAEDWAEWEFKVTRPGAFDVEVWQGCGQGQGGSEVAVEVGNERFTFVVQETGHFQIFIPRRVGRVTFPAAGTYKLALKPQRKQANAIMDVRQVKLVPISASAKASIARPGDGPLDEDGRPLIRKL